MGVADAHADVKLYDLIDVKNPSVLLVEIHHLVETLHPDFDFGFVDRVFADAGRLFQGEYPGYRSSTTMYHNLQHTLEVFLCAARLLHGAARHGVTVSARMTELTLASALMHDVGLIQEESDLEGTGAKYTVGHEQRSIAFLKHYFQKLGRPGFDIHAAAKMIECTCLGVDSAKIAFGDDPTRFCAQILATGDLLAQMADREYLEKLILLYLEFEEAGLPYESPRDLLEKTHGFYEMMCRRMDGPLGGVRRFLEAHFDTRWGVKQDLYEKSIQANMNYLYLVLEEEPENYLNKLKRGGIVQRIEPLL